MWSRERPIRLRKMCYARSRYYSKANNFIEIANSLQSVKQYIVATALLGCMSARMLSINTLTHPSRDDSSAQKPSKCLYWFEKMIIVYGLPIPDSIAPESRLVSSCSQHGRSGDADATAAPDRRPNRFRRRLAAPPGTRSLASSSKNAQQGLVVT